MVLLVCSGHEQVSYDMALLWRFLFQVASELNAAILEVDATPKLANLLKLLLWSQEEIDKKKIKYPRMTDFASGTIDDPKWLWLVW